MRIGFCRPENALDKQVWSGTPYYMYRALEMQFPGDVVCIGPLSSIFRFPARMIRQASRVLTHREYHYGYSRLMNLEYVRQIRRTLMRDDFDVLFFPASSSILKELDVDIPCVYLSDATFRIMTNYYHHL